MSDFYISLRDAKGTLMPGITARLQVGSDISVVAYTDGTGVAHWNGIKPKVRSRVEVAPIPGHWSMARDWDLTKIRNQNFQASSLPEAQDGIGWWHRAVAFMHDEMNNGKGIKAGII